MRHTIELKMPKLFGKKKRKEETVQVRTEVDVEEKVKELSVPMIIAGTAVAGLAVGYLVGHKAGVDKGGNVVVIK